MKLCRWRHPSLSNELPPWRGFTLLELLVVTTLMALAVGLVTLKLDGLTASGRAGCVATQVGSYVRLAQVEARTSGQARIVEVDVELGVVRIQRTPMIKTPKPPLELKLGSKAALTGVWFENECREVDQGLWSMRIDGNGRFRRCGLIFRSQETCAVCLLTCIEPPKVWVLREKPKATNLEELRAELVNDAAH